MAALAIPKALERFAGRITDVDTHEMIPVQLWEAEFGACTKPISDRYLSRNRPNLPGGMDFPDHKQDNVKIDADSVWKVKGATAPGATDPRRRLDVMDLTGVSRQIMYPSGLTVPALRLCATPPEAGYLPEYRGQERKDLGRQIFKANNDWAIRAAQTSDRIRPVTPIHEDNVDDLMATTKRLLDSGIRVILLMSVLPPGGKSPAHSDLDPFWRMIAERNAVATLHIGSEGCGFFKSDEWGNAPVFDGYKLNIEANLNPWYMSAVHLPAQNFLAAMVTGGVFERHPTLRFGCIELGAHWIGPMTAMLDMWHANNQQFGAMNVQRLPHKPSDYIRRNVRVSAFDFEHVDTYIDMYGLDDVYCYASDFPHIEGGKDPMGDFVKRLERLGSAVMEKFFVTNGELLLPA